MADNNDIKSKIFYISLHQKYTFGFVVHKTKSNQKLPKVKYSGSKQFLDMADNNHNKVEYILHIPEPKVYFWSCGPQDQK